jgi:hypothetical protein
MVDRLIPDALWRHQEAALRYRSHAKAARDAADKPNTPSSVRRMLMERWARLELRAQEEERQMKEMER